VLTVQGSDRRLWSETNPLLDGTFSVTSLHPPLSTDRPTAAADAMNGHWCPIGARRQSTQINSALVAAWPEVELLPTYAIRVFPRQVVILPLNQRVQGSSP
jgi:hypothetical protein